MKVHLLLAALLAYCTADSNFFKTFVENKLNREVKPCDDFFAHVCSATPDKEHFMSSTFLAMLRRFVPLFNNGCKEAFFEYVNANQTAAVVFPDEDTRTLAIQEKCSNDPPRCRKIVEIYYKVNADDMPLDEIVGKVSRLMLAIQAPAAKSRIDSFVVKGIMICAAEALYREADANATVRSEIEEAEARVDELVTKLKKVLVDKFEKTKWMQRSSSVKRYQELINSITRMKFYDEEYQPTVAKAAKLIDTRAVECLKVIFRWYPQEIRSCLAKGYEFAHHDMLLNFDDPNTSQHMDVLNVNAFYQPVTNTLGASASLTLRAPVGGVSQLGSLGFALIHELSHAVFKGPENIRSLSIDNIECIKEHRRQICLNETYFCKMGDPTITEDAPDIMGLAAALDLLQQEKEHNEEIPAGLTKEQYFFYTATASFCSDKLDHQITSRGIDTHSPRKGRMNALLMHSEIFQDAFSCKEGDRMWRKPSQFCHLLGPDAHRR